VAAAPAQRREPSDLRREPSDPGDPRRESGEFAAQPRPRTGDPDRSDADSGSAGGGPPDDRGGASRQQFPGSRRVRLAALVGAVVFLLGLLPAIFLIKDSGTDPVFAGLDQLNLPSFATQQQQDQSTGSRFCVKTCRLRERTWHSTKATDQTDPVYETALRQAGWRPWATAGCPKGVSGVYTCWQSDQFVLDLWTRNLPCDLATTAPTPAAGASAAPAPTPTGSGPPPTCAGSLVTAKVADRADPDWHR
jgi:hypothetical protein